MNTVNIYHGPLGLDKLPTLIKNLNWTLCFVLATPIVVYFGFGTLLQPLLEAQPKTSAFEYIAFLSPIYLAIAWLRLTGVSWRYALLLLIIIPLVWLIAELIMLTLAFVYINWLGD
jgi:hypothetical protein